MAKQYKWNQLVALDENKESYEPQQEQILEYASFLGLRFPEDYRFKFLIVEGLKAPLPPFWEACQTPDGQICFRNKKTRNIQLENPLDEIYKTKLQNLKLLQTRNNFFLINEQSQVNESSTLLKSNLKSSDLNNNPKQNRIMNRQITQQSIYSQKSLQNDSYNRQFYGMRSNHSKNEAQMRFNQEKNKHIMKLLEIKTNIMNYVPKESQLISFVGKNGLDLGNVNYLCQIMDIKQLEKIQALRTVILEKKLKLQKLNQMKDSLIQTKKQIKSQKINIF